jgi:hypothetical protein
MWTVSALHQLRYPCERACTQGTGGWMGPRAILEGAENLAFAWVQISHHVSDSFSVHRQESSTVRTAISICHTGYADCLLAASGWNSSILIPLASSQHNLYGTVPS